MIKKLIDQAAIAACAFRFLRQLAKQTQRASGGAEERECSRQRVVETGDSFAGIWSELKRRVQADPRPSPALWLPDHVAERNRRTDPFEGNARDPYNG